MRSIKSWLTPKTLQIGLLTLIVGCFKPDERHVGVDDFPNSIQAQVKGFLNESKKSEDINLVSKARDSILNPQGFHVAAGKNAAKKMSAATKSMIGLELLLAPSTPIKCESRFQFDTTKYSPFKTTVESFTICLDTSKRTDLVIKVSSISTYPNGRIDRAEITDADGDGILNPMPSGGSKAKMEVSTTDGGIKEQTTVIVGPGPDNDFDTLPDNVTYAVNWLKIKIAGSDTLGSAVYSDADLDGTVLDNAKASLVDLELYEKGPTQDHADALWSKVKMRIVVRYGIESKDAQRVHFEMQSKDGRLTTADLLNLEGGPDFNMRGKLKAQFLVVGTTPADTVDTMRTNLIMTVGSDLDNKSDDSVFALDVYVKKKMGEEKNALFTFASDLPIPSGKDPQSGRVSMHIEYSDASTVDLNGTMKDKSLDVKVKTRDDKQLLIVWDALGRGVLLEPIH
jgi:hypothetical protein